jgi:hypothetical protein
MVSTNEAVDALCRHIGFDPPRAAAVAKKLTEAGSIPPGGQGKSPELDPDHVLAILLGSSVDAPLRAIAAMVEQYRSLVPGGANLVGAPATIDRNAGDALEVFADIAVHGDSDLLRRDKIEIVSNWPEVAILRDGKVARFVPVGALATHWRDSGHRKSTIISGAALVDCLHALFGENHDR